MENQIEGKPPWYKQEVSNLINIPIGYDINLPFGYNYVKCISNINKNTDNESYCFLDANEDNIAELNIKEIDNKIKYDVLINKYHKKYVDKVAKIKKEFMATNIEKTNTEKVKDVIKLNIKKGIAKIKTATTKAIKQCNNVNKTTICKQYYVYPTEKQKKILNEWFTECKKVYNKCVDLYNANNKYFNKGHMSVKTEIFELIYGESDKGAPYDILTDEIRIFCSNLKSSRTNVERGHQNHYKMHHKNIDSNHSMFLPKTCINNDSIYKNHLGTMRGIEKIDHDIVSDCRLNYDKLRNMYILSVPVYVKIKDSKHKQQVVALDPGEKIFQSYYSLEGFGHIGKDMRIPILKIEKNIRKYQRALSNNVNKKGEKIKSKKNLKLKIKKCYEKIKNISKDLHNKTALYLCRNYNHILIPEFKTQNMVRNTVDSKCVNPNHERIKEIFNDKGRIEGMKELKKYNKKRRLNGRVKFVLNMLSHYKFRRHLSNKCAEYGCEMCVVTEEHTSKTCTKCGHISNKYNKREKECSHCGYKINRDINGSRNILIKNIGLIRGI